MFDRQSQIMRANHFFLMIFCFGAVVLGTYGWVSGEVFYLRLATEALIFAGLALSVDLLLGCTGALSLGQALYFGIGAYASALIMLQTSSFWLAMLGAGVASIVAAFLGGLIANRVRGVYFTLITLGLAQVIGKVIYNTRELGSFRRNHWHTGRKHWLRAMVSLGGQSDWLLLRRACDHCLPIWLSGLSAGDAIWAHLDSNQDQ